MKKRGKGLAISLYPSGMSGGGDTSQALVRVKQDGSVDLIIGSVDLGQGAKTVLAQMAAEELGVSYDQVNVISQGTDVGPLCFGTYASRITFFTGNAVIRAAREARDILFEVAAGMLKAAPEELATGEGLIYVRSEPERAVKIRKVAAKSIFGNGRLIVGRGYYRREASPPDPETGSCDPFATMAWAAVLAEVEVDTRTGEVTVLDLHCAYDVGRAINPLQIEGQIEGGAAMSIGAALMEELHPYFPTLDWQARSLGEYVIPTTKDVPELKSAIYECPSTNGPYGAKGIGEMTANTPAPAIVDAIHDAIGVWITELPVTPEKILRALEQKEQAAGVKTPA